MKRSLILISLCSFLLSIISLQAQSITARVVDKKTGIGVPYATIEYQANRGVITNEEGRFSIKKPSNPSINDSIYISSLGYEKTAIPLLPQMDSILFIEAKAIELNEVYLFDKELTVEEIIEKVKENLSKNYQDDPIKQRLFYRQSSFNTLTKLDIVFEESTIEELNKKFLDSVVSILPRNAAYYTESLADYFQKPEEDKLQLTKAAELYDKNNEGSMEALSAKLEKIFKDNVKPDSFLKIKSGWFGQKVQVDSILNESIKDSLTKAREEADGEYPFLGSRKRQLNSLYTGLFYKKDSKLNFLDKSNRYEFDLKGYSAIGDDGVYIVDFLPKRAEDFKGTLYINIQDFAIMRIDYENVKSLKKIKLLGFSYEEINYEGTSIFTKDQNSSYKLRFLDKTLGRKMGVRRPLSVIEKNKYVKGKRKQNELSMEIDLINFNTEKYEVIVFETENISVSAFDKAEENPSIKATYLSEYDPEFWEGYDIMEPNKAIREFSASK